MPWYGDINVFNQFISDAIDIPNALYEYPIDDDKEPMDPIHMPENWQGFPIIKAAVAYKKVLKKSNERMKGILC